jgi:hypothetical protein
LPATIFNASRSETWATVDIFSALLMMGFTGR